MSIASKIATACDTLRDLREELHEGSPTAERATRLREQIASIKDRQISLHAAYDAAWNATLGPVMLRQDRPDGPIYQVQASPMSGGRSIPVMPDDPQYPELVAEMKRRSELDAKVAEVAFAAWGWRGAVRIDYYGTAARVTNGGKSLMVRLDELPE